MRKAIHIILISLALCIASAKVFAGNEHEYQELSRLLNELHYLDNIILVAKNSASANSRTHFDYEALERDIQLIKRGISEYLDGDRRHPRTIENVTGDFSNGS